jgi:hypothetical protein
MRKEATSSDNLNVVVLKPEREIIQQENMYIEKIFILEILNWENQHLHRYLLILAKPTNIDQH